MHVVLHGYLDQFLSEACAASSPVETLSREHQSRSTNTGEDAREAEDFPRAAPGDEGLAENDPNSVSQPAATGPSRDRLVPFSVAENAKSCALRRARPPARSSRELRGRQN